jgi:hypothetical protein
MLADIIQWGTILTPSAVVLSYVKFSDRRRTKRRKQLNEAEIASKTVDGRTHDEWYDLIHAMGKEQFELLSIAPLDGLERSTEVGWNAKRLMGADNYDKLRREWYPEEFKVAIKSKPAREIRNASSLYWFNDPIFENKPTVVIDYNKPKPSFTKFVNGSGSYAYKITYNGKVYIMTDMNVRKFQAFYGLDETGDIDAETKNTIKECFWDNDLYLISVQAKKPADKLSKELKEMDTILQMQKQLDYLKNYGYTK